MLQELITLTETLDFEENGGIIVVSATWQNGKEDLEICVDLNRGNDDVQKWTLLCKSEREHNIILGWGDNLEVANDHVLLWPHNETVHKLWFNGSGEDTSAIIGALWQAHHKLVGDWFPFSRFFNCSDDFAGLVMGGHGNLAEGPEPLINAYQQVLEASGIKTTITTHQPLHWNGSAWVEPGELVALFVGKCHVIASNIEARK